MRTPLTSIVGYIETLQNHARDDPSAREQFLGIMAKQADRMHRLIDDLMSLSRIEMDANQRPVEVLDFHKNAAEATASMLPMARSNNIRLEMSLPIEHEGPFVRGDRDQLYQVFANLIENAIKYCGKDPVVRIEPAEPDLRYPRMVGIHVHDNGPGIDPRHIHRITERFYRVNPTTSRDRGGTGLGLSIVKHTLNRHEGSLDITSRPKEGSTFSVWLPEVSAPENFSN